MKSNQVIIRYLLTSVLLFSLFNQCFAEQTELRPKVIYIAGDSTAASYNKPDHQGWAGVLNEYFSADKVKIDNRARGGRSSRTFITEGLWQLLIDDVKEGDMVLIQFGHNDGGNINDDHRARGSIPGIGDEQRKIFNLLTKQDETVYSFGHYIRKMVNEVKAKKAIPVLISLTVRNIWQGQKIERGSGSYGAWMYQLAWELETPFIDLTNQMADYFEGIGAEETAGYYPKDHTHFNPSAAHVYAKTVLAGLKGIKPTLDAGWYSVKGAQVEKDGFTWLRLPFVANKNLPSVFFVGDSTVRNGAGDGSNGEWGWGDFIQEHISVNQVNLVNRAIGGLSSRTFVTGGYWQRALNMMRPGDKVLIQFGHNDAAALNDDSRARGTIRGTSEAYADIDNMLTGKAERVHSYGWYLRKMVGEALARGITPIICSPVPRKIWTDESGVIKRTQDSYPQWAQVVARQSGVAFIDLHNLVADKYNRLGQEQVDALFADKHTHTSKTGAQLTADIVATDLKYILGL